MGMCWHSAVDDLLSITSQIWHQSLSDKSCKTVRPGESQPSHRLHHLNQKHFRTHAHTLTFQRQTIQPIHRYQSHAFTQTFSTRPTTSTLPHYFRLSVRICPSSLCLTERQTTVRGVGGALLFELELVWSIVPIDILWMSRHHLECKNEQQTGVRCALHYPQRS